MIWIYLSALVFGGMFVIPMFLGGLDVDADFGADTDLDTEFDTDLDTEFDTDVDGAVDAASAIDAVGTFLDALISFRSLVFFSFFFGLSGVLFKALGSSPQTATLLAAAIGLAAAVLNAQLLSYVKRHNSNSLRTSAELRGRPAKIILPVNGTSKGRIRIDLDGQPTFLVALPYEADERFDVGDSVVVVEVEKGTARVAMLDLGLSNTKEEK